MKTSNRLGQLFGGCLDVAHGFTLTDELEMQLRFLALFAERIVVPDAFFHCYGPIYFRAKKFSDRSVSTLDPEVKNDILLGLINAGIVVPALRTDSETLEENFNSDRVEKGYGLIPTAKEAQEVIQFLDALLNGRRAEAQWKREFSRRTYDALSHQFLKSSLPDLQNKLIIELNLDSRHDSDWARSLDFFLEAISSQANRSYFQRGPLEHALAKGLQCEDARIYNYLSALDKSSTTSRGRLIRYLFSEMVSYYQIGQGSAFGTIPAVTTALSGHLLDPQALAKALGSAAAQVEFEWIPLHQPINSSFLSKLDVNQILDLRNGPLVEFRARITNLLKNSTSAVDTRQQFLEESRSYREQIASTVGSPTIDLVKNLFAFTPVLLPDQVPKELKWALCVLMRQVSEKFGETMKTARDKSFSYRLGRDFNNFLGEK
jgi:hypothetical protein